MLLGNLPERANKGACSREPLVDHNRQGILIAGESRFSPKLLRSHVRQSTGHLLPTQEFSRGEQQGEAKITEQDLSLRTQEQIFWLDIAMDHVARMSILKCCRHVLDVGNNR